MYTYTYIYIHTYIHTNIDLYISFFIQAGVLTLALGPDSVLDNIARHAKGFAGLLREKQLLTNAKVIYIYIFFLLVFCGPLARETAAHQCQGDIYIYIYIFFL